MSHILDALKKVQEEKVAKVRETSITAGSLLNTRRVDKGRASRFIPWVTAVAVLFAVLSAGWIVLKPSPSTLSKAASALPPASENRPQAPAMPATDMPPPLPPPAVATPEARSPALPPPVKPKEAEPSIQNKKPEYPQPASHSVKEPAPRIAGTTLEGVKLQGVAWQEEKRARKAIINDTLIGEGAEIAGAKILEIQQHKVRVEKNGMVYELLLPQ